MRDRFALLDGPALRAQAETALAAVGTAAMRRAAAHLREESMAIPAPCGCAPTVRCDRHCRVKIHPTRDLKGRRSWSAECTGVGGLDYPHESDRMGCGDLWTLHEWATEHVARHRLRAFARTE